MAYLRMIGWIATATLVVYLGLVAAAWAMQSRMIYPAPPVSTELPDGFERVTYRTADGLDLVAGYRPARDGMPTVLFFHGNGTHWQSSAWVTRDLAGHGYGVLAAEYRGYGGNPGVPGEAGLYADGRAARAYLHDRGVAADEIVLVGNSIGSGVATQLATEIEPLALVLVSPFDSLAATAARKVRWLPVKMLLRDRYDNRAKLPAVAAPVLILHGGADTLIAPEQAQALADARPGTELVIHPGRGHDLIADDEVQSRIASFVAELRTDR
ncbi:alpha/beta hydrolase [Aurantiacibacter spongiae]|uniref:Alpha/beta fold hydrolase n=1 Tax=Aurantiacibacter spongiae TaxID=2488860 RepID=A0A3N5DA07_9SPHN|nr:alpha/beta fold hydrolase [Aurantiacibacter spongiae]RPF71478.1 alpha/beta fold hydrolase [Aurantiacibacter spongiae]